MTTNLLYFFVKFIYFAMNGIGDESMDATERHVQITFITKEKGLDDLPESIFDVPVSADCENLNSLFNKTIQLHNDDWKERRFEFLIGETFVRSTLEEFIEEYRIETETVIRVECILTFDAPKPLHDLPAPDWVSSVNIASYSILSTTYSGEVVIWDRKGNQQVSLNPEKSGSFKCSAIVTDSRSSKALEGVEFLVGGEGQNISLVAVDGPSSSTKMLFRGHERSVEALSVNNDKTRFVSGAFDNYVKVWNLDEKDTDTIYEKDTSDKAKKRKANFITKTPMVTLSGHKDAVVGLKWATWNPAHAISASWDHTLAVWDLELAGEVSRIRGQKAFTSIDVNKSGLVISGSTDAVPRLYDPRSSEGALVKQSFVGHNGWVSGVKWSPDKDGYFVSASFDKVVKMWDIRSAKTSLFDLHGHSDRALCVDWNHGFVASGSVDCSVKVFTLAV